MNESDQAAAVLAAAILKTNGRDIEAMTLEAIAEDSDNDNLDSAVADASKSDAKAGAFGMEIVGAIVVPVLIEAARQFWKAYSEKLTEKGGEALAEWTIEKFKDMFSKSDTAKQSDTRDQLAAKIRSVGTERGLSTEDIDAILEAMTPQKLSDALASAG